jgi:acyl transferase domain-containing protein
VIAHSKAELVERLDLFLQGRSYPEFLIAGETDAVRRRLAFVFSGQGSQWLGMGSELFGREPAFRASLEACDAALQPELGWSLLDRLFRADSATELESIDAIQPALFGIQIALAALWRTWGVEPDAVVGHSMGEVAAAYVAGGLTLREAARIVAVRSRLLRRVSGQGGMALVGLPAEVTATHLPGHGEPLAIAASNGPRSTVVAGEVTALDALLARLEQQGVFCRRIKVDVAAHGPQAAPLAEELRRGLEGLAPRSGPIPFFSSVSGSRFDTGQLGPAYWARNLTEPVNFAGALQDLVAEEAWDVLEISPHPLLQSSVLQGMQHRGRDGIAQVSLRRGEGERATLLQSLAALYISGRAIAWDRISALRGTVVSLPAYPWQRQRFWLAGAENGGAPRADATPRPTSQRRGGRARLRLPRDGARGCRAIGPRRLACPRTRRVPAQSGADLSRAADAPSVARASGRRDLRVRDLQFARSG